MNWYKRIKNLYGLILLYKFKSLLLVLKHSYLKKQGIKKICLRNGLKFIVNLNKKEHTVVQDLILTKVYKYSYNRKNVNIILDVGANIGVYTILIAKMYPKATVYSFEPNPDVIDRYKKNIKLNNIKNNILLEYGLSDKNTNKILYIDKDNSLISSMKFEEVNEFSNSISEIKIKTISVNSFLNKYNIEYIDIIKLDCEGYEKEIFEQLDKINFIKKIRYIVTDIQNNNIKFVKNLLKINNFEIKLFSIGPIFISGINKNKRKIFK